MADFLRIPANPHLINSTLANNPSLRRQAGPPRVVTNPSDAGQRSFHNGQAVKVFNDRGNFSAELVISDQVRAGVLATTKGGWLKHIAGSNLNATVDERDADLGGGSVFSDNRVGVSASN